MAKFSLEIKRFAHARTGMVTVEWVALSAAVLIGGIAIAWTVLNNLDATASLIGPQAGAAAGTVTSSPSVNSPDFTNGSASN